MLLARPGTQPDECVVSYLIRVSENNGFKHIGHLLHYAGLNWKNNRVPVHQILSGEFSLAPLLSALGLPECSSGISLTYQSFQRAIDTPNVIVKYPKVCPECLEELGYCKYQWALLPVVACPKHKRILIDVSPASGRRLGWYRQHLNRFDGETNHILPSSRCANAGAIEQSFYIESLLSGNKSEKLIPVVLQGLAFRESLSLIHFIAHYQIRLLGGSFSPVTMQNHELSQIYEKVWVTLQGWPDSFYALLSQYVDQPMSNKGLSGLHKHFRDLYERLYRQQENQGIARVKAEFDYFIEQYWPGVLESERITRIHLAPISRNTISKKDAASILGTRLERVDKFVNQRRLTAIIFEGKVHYQRDQVGVLANEISSNWSMADACEALELTRYQLKQLLDAGVIPVLQRPNSLNRDWVIDKTQCLSLIEELRRKARKSEPPSGALSMAGVQRQGYSIVQLVMAMQTGDIEFSALPRYSSSVSFRQFSFFHCVIALT